MYNLIVWISIQFVIFSPFFNTQNTINFTTYILKIDVTSITKKKKKTFIYYYIIKVTPIKLIANLFFKNFIKIANKFSIFFF